MRLAFYGNPEIASKLLQELLFSKKDEVIYVITNPPKPKKRGLEPTPTPVQEVLEKNYRNENNLKFSKNNFNRNENIENPQTSQYLKKSIKPELIYTPNFKDEQIIKKLKNYEIDVLIVFAFGVILDEQILKLPLKGSLNLHASLLPQLRGASPIQSAILENLSETGFSVQLMNRELDAGNIIIQEKLEINSNENCLELTNKLLPIGINLIFKSLDIIRENENFKSIPQSEIKNYNVSYCKKISKENAKINWYESSLIIHNKIRAFNPKPLAWTLFQNKKLIIFKSKIITNEFWEKEESWNLEKNNYKKGFAKIIKNKKEIWVCTGDGVISLLELQLENRNKLDVATFINGLKLIEIQLGV